MKSYRAQLSAVNYSRRQDKQTDRQNVHSKTPASTQQQLYLQYTSFREIHKISKKASSSSCSSPMACTTESVRLTFRTWWYHMRKPKQRNAYTVSQKKLCHFYFCCNFGKCWSIFKILSMSESERNGS